MSNYASFSIKCGSVTNSFEELKKLCQKEADKLSGSIEVPQHEEVKVPFWTADIAELICVGKFKRDDNDTIVYELDFTECTL